MDLTGSPANIRVLAGETSNTRTRSFAHLRVRDTHGTHSSAYSLQTKWMRNNLTQAIKYDRLQEIDLADV